MTLTERRICNLRIRRAEIMADIADRVKRHMPRTDQERELRFVTLKLVRLENVIARAA